MTDKTQDALAALREAIEFQNQDTVCLAAEPNAYGPVSADEPEDCQDPRCRAHGCMVARVNRWRAALIKAEERT